MFEKKIFRTNHTFNFWRHTSLKQSLSETQQSLVSNSVCAHDFFWSLQTVPFFSFDCLDATMRAAFALALQQENLM